MLDDLRLMKERIERAQKEKALEQEKNRKEARGRIYGDVERKFKETERKNAEAKTRSIRLERTFSYFKFSAVFAIFAVFAFCLNSALSDKSGRENVTILNDEAEAGELDAKLAERYVRRIVDNIGSAGTSSISKHWESGADEETRFYGEELLSGVNNASLKIYRVRKLPGSRFKVECSCDSHPLSLRIARNDGAMSLLSVE